MTEEYQVTLPKLGESILSATIVQWFKKVGDKVYLDEPLLEVSTDKVNSEIPSPVSGTILEILAEPDQEFQVGDVLAVIQREAQNVTEHTPSQITIKREDSLPSSQEGRDIFSPALLRLARENNISMKELEKISATGTGGRLTKRDLEVYLETKAPSSRPCPLGTEHVKMTGMRKAIADNMVKSFYEAPHASLVTEVDVTEALKFIQQEKEKILAEHGIKLTITAVVAKALVSALHEYPLLNSSLEGDTIVIKRFIHLGIAVSVEQGILVPVIKNCQLLSITDLARAISDLSLRARQSKIVPSEMQEGTITLTNFGISGVEIGIPIIRYPEVAIVGIGAIHKKVVVLDDETIGIRSRMHVSLTFDHRVLDGMYGCGFLKSLKHHLEQSPYPSAEENPGRPSKR